MIIARGQRYVSPNPLRVDCETHNPLGSISSMRSLTRSHISRPKGTWLESVHVNEKGEPSAPGPSPIYPSAADDDTHTRVLLFRVPCVLAISGY